MRQRHIQRIEKITAALADVPSDDFLCSLCRLAEMPSCAMFDRARPRHCEKSAQYSLAQIRSGESARRDAEEEARWLAEGKDLTAERQRLASEIESMRRELAERKAKPCGDTNLGRNG